ncbi:MAG: hypothetical protein MRY21_01375 [Simkaniaceae bacterium]|nr:hypothetical protein [Simkaniaceae bacterium]
MSKVAYCPPRGITYTYPNDKLWNGLKHTLGKKLDRNDAVLDVIGRIFVAAVSPVLFLIFGMVAAIGRLAKKRIAIYSADALFSMHKEALFGSNVAARKTALVAVANHLTSQDVTHPAFSLLREIEARNAADDFVDSPAYDPTVYGAKSDFVRQGLTLAILGKNLQNYKLPLSSKQTSKERAHIRSLNQVLDVIGNNRRQLPQLQAPQVRPNNSSPYGLNNLGNTCYLNSVMQGLFLNKKMASILDSMLKEMENPTNDPDIKNRNRLAKALRDIRAEFIRNDGVLPNRGNVDHLLLAVQNQAGLESYQQEDPQVLIMALLQKLLWTKDVDGRLPCSVEHTGFYYRHAGCEDPMSTPATTATFLISPTAVTECKSLQDVINAETTRKSRKTAPEMMENGLEQTFTHFMPSTTNDSPPPLLFVSLPRGGYRKVRKEVVRERPLSSTGRTSSLTDLRILGRPSTGGSSSDGAPSPQPLERTRSLTDIPVFEERLEQIDRQPKYDGLLNPFWIPTHDLEQNYKGDVHYQGTAWIIAATHGVGAGSGGHITAIVRHEDDQLFEYNDSYVRPVTEAYFESRAHLVRLVVAKNIQ